MATLSITVDNAIAAKVTLALRDALGKESVGLTDGAVAKLFIKRAVEKAYRHYSLRTDTAALSATAQSSATTARAAEETARQAVKDAETTVLAQVATDMAGVS